MRNSCTHSQIDKNYFEKIKQGGCFFIGASVTAQKNGWTHKLVELIGEKLGCPFPVGKRAMGSVGIIFGVTNWLDTPLPKEGVVFIEFSSGDLNLGLTPLDQLGVLLENLIIDIFERKSLPIIIHNWRSDFREEKGDIVRKIYNDVASKFKVPVIRNDLFVEEELKKDPGIDKIWFRDICHTTPEGAFAYAKHVFDGLCSMSDSLDTSFSNVQSSKVLRGIQPLFDLDKYFNSSNYTICSYTYPNTSQEFSYYDCDASVEFEAIASGQLVGIALISEPTSGWVELLVNGESKKLFRCFDRHSYYKRFIMLPAFYNLSNTLVKLRLSEKPVDFSIANQDHEAFKEKRRMQLVSLVGVELKLQPYYKEIRYNYK